jgi:hypothetical protein
LCKVNGPIKLHNGRAFVRPSGFGMALDVLMLNVTRGGLGHGLQIAALQVWCDNTGGTADGELAEGIFVFDSPGGHPHLLGTLTPQLKGNPMLHIRGQSHRDHRPRGGQRTLLHARQRDLLSVRARNHPLEVDRPHLHPGPHQDHERMTEIKTGAQH